MTGARTILAVVIDARGPALHIVVTPHDADTLAARALDVLSPFERERCAKVLLPAARTLRIAAHVVKRYALGAALGCAPRDVPFIEPSDRPRLAAPHEKVHASLSHASDAVAIAFGHGPIGVDIETLDRSGDPVAIARRFFGPGEADRVAAARDGFEFAWRWTAKEALKKAADITLFDALARPMPLGIDPLQGFRAHGLQFDVLVPATGYVCSVARVTA